MKIGLFTDTFYPEINGVATSCLNLQRELTRRGHEVHVYAPKCKGWEENQRENVHYLASAPLLLHHARRGGRGRAADRPEIFPMVVQPL